MSWLTHLFGLDNGSGPFYLAWSGAGSDLGELALFAGMYALIRRHQCHVDRCWRIGIRKVPGTEHTVCHRHHPNPPPTHADVVRDHQQAQRS